MPVRVLIIDDSPYTRAALSAITGSIPGVKVVATAVDGFDGMRQAMKLKPDLIILDLEMPNLDGFGFLRMMKDIGDIPVLVVSGKKGKDNAVRAIEYGAMDCIEKPSAYASGDIVAVKESIAEKVSLLPFMRKRKRPGVNKTCAVSPSLVAVGASTGGPRAVSALINALPGGFSSTMVVAVHMPPWLTAPFIGRLSSEASVPVIEAVDGATIQRGTVLIAPGGRHISFEKGPEGVSVKLTVPEKGDLCVPSVDRLFESAAGVFGAGVVGVVLTGMGSDGARGVAAIKDRGGFVIAESRESATISGMPDSAISTGKVDLVLPVGRIAAWIAGIKTGTLKLA